jgi:hypothetical protein
MESRSRSMLDTPLEPVIGLAEGETRWRGMTALGVQGLSAPFSHPTKHGWFECSTSIMF